MRSIDNIGTLCAFFLLFTCSVFINADNDEIKWETTTLNSSWISEATAEEPINLFVQSRTAACVYDPILISWSASQSKLFNVDWQRASLLIASAGSSSAISTSIGSIRSSNNPSHSSKKIIEISTLSSDSAEPNDNRFINELEQSNEVHSQNFKIDSTLIKCLNHNMFCTPSPISIFLSPSSEQINIEFDQDTSTPQMIDLQSIQRALEFSPPLEYEAHGIWVNRRQCNLIIDIRDRDNIILRHQEQQPVNVKVIQEVFDREYIHGERTFRPTKHGELKVFAIDTSTGSRISAISTIKINICEDESILPFPTRKIETLSTTAVPSFSLKGVFAITGNSPVKISKASIPAMDVGTWSVSFWIRLVEGPTGAFRSIMFKGSSSDSWQQRTPSVWLMPNSNHITIHVSTNETADFPIYSRSEISMNKWTSVAFVFRNITQQRLWHLRTSEDDAKDVFSLNGGSSETTIALDALKNYNEKVSYEIELYIDGGLDTKAQYAAQVLSNPGDLTLFKDVTFQGPRSFVQGLFIWTGTLTESEVLSQYLKGVEGSAPVDDIIDIISRSEVPLLPFLEHAYLQKDSDSKGYIVEALGVESSESSRINSKPNQAIFEFLSKKSKESINQCDLFEKRVDIHSESAEVGSIEGLYYWAKLLLYGFEIPDSRCGFSTAAKDSRKRVRKDLFDQNRDKMNSQQKFGMGNVELLNQDCAAAAMALTLAAERGNAASLVPLAFSILHEIGLDGFVHFEESLSDDWNIPKPAIFSERQLYDDDNSRLRTALGKYIKQSLDSAVDNSIASPTHPLYEIGEDQIQQFNRTRHISLINLANGLLYLAALYGDPEAHMALAYRYEKGIDGIAVDLETAAHYSLIPVNVASKVFEENGAQMIAEVERIDDNTVRDIGKGHQGNDDEAIEYQKLRAKEGDIPSMLAMGELYYYGARGLPRDYSEALRYYSQAAAQGDPSGTCGVANMYLKGEGVPVNVSKAIELYEKAALNDSIRAFNGLGYLYFYGSQVQKNDTKAFEYFMKAASYESDGDSVFNAAYCLENGVGTPANIDRAIYYYNVAATKLGHFNSVRTMGIFYLEGKGVTRSADKSLFYLNAAKAIGPWVGWLRRGFDLFLATKDNKFENSQYALMRSLACYLHAGELGFEIAQSNAAYLIRSKLASSAVSASPISSSATAGRRGGTGSYSIVNALDQNLLRMYSLSGEVHNSAESLLQLGNIYFVGKLIPRDSEKALHYYKRASYLNHGLANVYLAVMNHFGIGIKTGPNHIRAARYYDEALNSKSLESVQLKILVKSLKGALSMTGYSLMNPINLGVEYVVKLIWGN